MHFKNTSEKLFLVIVDDDADDLELIKDVYEELMLPKKIITLTSADKLISLLEQVPDPSLLPSLIVLDYNMPKVSGLELLHMLKLHKRFKNIPVIFYSTTVTVEIEETLLSAGAVYCFQKPVTIKGVRDFMKQIWSIADSFQQRNAVL
jgi:CheY-like chemotaxis protein